MEYDKQQEGKKGKRKPQALLFTSFLLTQAVIMMHKQQPLFVWNSLVG
jgi:hypothetical protein